MKFSCTKENLNKVLTLVTGVAGKNVNLPILSNILIKANEQKVEIAATNLELQIIANLRAKVETTGNFTVPARTLADFVALLTGDKVDIELQENELAVKCGKTTTKIKGAPADDFPALPAISEGLGYVVDAKEFKNGLEQVLPAVARNDIRPELSGVFFGFNSNGARGIIMAATDSYRLAEKKMLLKQGDQEKQLVVPGRAAQEMSRILAVAGGSETEVDARLLISDNQVVLNYDSVQLMSRLVDGKYPDYTQIVPHDFKTTAEFSVGQLTKEVKAAALFTTSGVNAVSLDLNASEKTIGVSSTSAQTGEYVSEIEAEVRGEENSVLLNHRYVLDGLNNLGSDQATLEVIGADSPCLFRPQGDNSYLYIVMPIRQ